VLARPSPKPRSLAIPAPASQSHYTTASVDIGSVVTIIIVCTCIYTPEINTVFRGWLILTLPILYMCFPRLWFPYMVSVNDRVPSSPIDSHAFVPMDYNPTFSPGNSLNSPSNATTVLLDRCQVPSDNEYSFSCYDYTDWPMFFGSALSKFASMCLSPPPLPSSSTVMLIGTRSTAALSIGST
jgi:hypothetical protein